MPLFSRLSMKTLLLLIGGGIRGSGTSRQVTIPRSGTALEHVHKGLKKHGGYSTSRWWWVICNDVIYIKQFNLDSMDLYSITSPYSRQGLIWTKCPDTCRNTVSLNYLGNIYSGCLSSNLHYGTTRLRIDSAAMFTAANAADQLTISHTWVKIL